MSYTGANLVFLISQPRAGSTMLQRVLGGHSDIHTLAEPWCMLHPCLGLKGDGYAADYQAGGWAGLAEENFYRQIGGRQTRVAAIRAMAEVVYGATLQDTTKDPGGMGKGQRCFLDKTPRYYYIISELAEVFPDAHFIILLRNPLAVLCSIVRTWVDGHWDRLKSYRDDLLLAPKCLVNGVRDLEERALVVRYEQLVQDPGPVVAELCSGLGLDFDENMLDYGRRMNKPMAFGDSSEVNVDARPDSSAAARWHDDLHGARVWRLASDYLGQLGRRTVEDLGYPHEQLAARLQSSRPGLVRTRLAPPLLRLLSREPVVRK